MSTMYIIALILIFCGGVGAILLAIDQSLSSTESTNFINNTTISQNSELKKELKEIKKERDSLSETLALRDANIQDKTEKIIDLSLKLDEKSVFIQNYISGGDGYLFLDIRTFPHKADGTQEFIFQLDNKFEMPIYNISCEIIDYNILSSKTYSKPTEKLPFIKYSDYYDKAYLLNLKYPEIQGKNSVFFSQDVFKTNETRYFVKIHTRNRNILEKIAIFKIGNKSFFGYAIYDTHGNKLYEKIDDEYHNAIKQKLIRNLESMPNVLELGFDKD